MPRKKIKFHPFIETISSVAFSISDNKPAFTNLITNIRRRITEAELAQIEHLDWVPKALLEFARTLDGVHYGWEAAAPDAHQGPVAGNIYIPNLQDICGSWEGTVYFANDPAPRKARLESFKLVDFFADEAAVGCYCSPAQDQQLYYFNFEDEPQPLGVDFRGYLSLLPFTLGYRYWQQLLLELFLYHPAAGPFQPQRTQALVENLQRVVPTFDLAAFVSQYEQVRLPR